MGFCRQEYWSGLPCSPPRDLPVSGIKPMSLRSPALAGEFFTTSATWEAHHTACRILIPHPEIEPAPPAMEVPLLKPWTTKGSPWLIFKWQEIHKIEFIGIFGLLKAIIIDPCMASVHQLTLLRIWRSPGTLAHPENYDWHLLTCDPAPHSLALLLPSPALSFLCLLWCLFYYWVGLKSRSGFSITAPRKTRMNVLATQWIFSIF